MSDTTCNATIELTRWTERCGVHASIVMRIFKYAVCCGGVVKLPDNPCLNAVGSCFHFSPMKTCPTLRPNPFKLELISFFYVKPPRHCYEPSDLGTTMRLMRAHQRYSEFVNLPSGGCQESDDDAVYAHVRSGDIFRKRHYSIWMYQQPPLSFFINAWKHSNKTKLVVISEDRANPVVPALERLPNVITRISDRVEEHRSLLRCASTLILSNSNFGLMAFRANRRVRDLYAWNWKHDAIYSNIHKHQLVNGRCDTRVHVVGTTKEDMEKREKWNGLSNKTRTMLLHEATRYQRTTQLACA